MTSEQEWEKLLYKVIFEGIIFKLSTGEVLSEAQQRWIDRFPGYNWPEAGEVLSEAQQRWIDRFPGYDWPEKKA